MDCGAGRAPRVRGDLNAELQLIYDQLRELGVAEGQASDPLGAILAAVKTGPGVTPGATTFVLSAIPPEAFHDVGEAVHLCVLEIVDLIYAGGQTFEPSVDDFVPICGLVGMIAAER
jgi:hypothetical protein